MIGNIVEEMENDYDKKRIHLAFCENQLNFILLKTLTFYILSLVNNSEKKYPLTQQGEYPFLIQKGLNSQLYSCAYKQQQLHFLPCTIAYSPVISICNMEHHNYCFDVSEDIYDCD